MSAQELISGAPAVAVSSDDARWMRMALREARHGLGRTSPNPAVGAVLVRDGRIVGRGFHARAGGPHAEVVALSHAGELARGADLYTTLEPCDHVGRTGPCSLAILRAGIRRVYSGSRDPNPLVNGRGVGRLRAAGVEVIEDVLRAECDAHLAQWLVFMRERRPFVTLEAAVTPDGRIATRAGDSRWASGSGARHWTHRLRDTADAILVGAGTSCADDPTLTTRLPRGRDRQPVRVVLDTDLKLPSGLTVVGAPLPTPTLVVHAEGLSPRRPTPEVEHLAVRRGTGGVDLGDLLAGLAARGIVHLLVEGRSAVFARFLEAGLADRVVLLVAPEHAGAKDTPAFALPWPPRIGDVMSLTHVQVHRAGDDVVIEGRPAYERAARAGAIR